MSEPLVLRWSDLQLYRRCPAKFILARKGTRSARPRINAKMIYGTLWHAAFAARMTGESIASAIERVANEQPDEARPLIADLAADLEADLAWYDHEAPPLRFERIEWVERPEQRLVLEVSPMLAIAGTPDLIAHVEADWGSGLVVVDHKTHAILHETASGPRYEPKPRESALTRYFHSRQFAFYCGLFSRLNPDRSCETALLNLVPQRVTHVLRFLESRRGTPKMPTVRREVIPYDTTFCARIVDEAIATAREIEGRLNDPNAVWPQHDHTCVEWDEVCPFLEFCEASDETRKAIEEIK